MMFLTTRPTCTCWTRWTCRSARSNVCGRRASGTGRLSYTYWMSAFLWLSTSITTTTKQALRHFPTSATLSSQNYRESMENNIDLDKLQPLVIYFHHIYSMQKLSWKISFRNYLRLLARTCAAAQLPCMLACHFCSIKHNLLFSHLHKMYLYC